MLNCFTTEIPEELSTASRRSSHVASGMSYPLHLYAYNNEQFICLNSNIVFFRKLLVVTTHICKMFVADAIHSVHIDTSVVSESIQC